MKRTLSSVFLALLLLSLCMPTCAEEAKLETSTSGDFVYILLEDGTAEITGLSRYIEKDGQLTIPDELDGFSVTSIGKWAFSDCSGLTSVTVPDSVTSIGDFAFSFCYDLTSITIPESVVHVGNNPFVSCKKLIKINVSPDQSVLANANGVLFSKPDKRLICYPVSKQEKDYQIPYGVQIIGELSFSGCIHLTSISIPESVTSIGEKAFSGCYYLASITIPCSVTTIGEKAFYFCSDDMTITVGRDSYAVQYCKENNLNYTYNDSLDWLNN